MSEAWPDVAEPGNRDAILAAAAALAGSDGLDGPSPGTLAMVLGRNMAGGRRGRRPAGVRTERHHAGHRHQLRPARGPGRDRPGPADRPPAARGQLAPADWV